MTYEEHLAESEPFLKAWEDALGCIPDDSDVYMHTLGKSSAEKEALLVGEHGYTTEEVFFIQCSIELKRRGEKYQANMTD